MNTNLAESRNPKIHRACDKCRVQKIRCNGPQTYPKNCSNCKNVPCTYKEAAPKKGKSQELERKVRTIHTSVSAITNIEKIAKYESMLEKIAPELLERDTPKGVSSKSQKRKRNQNDEGSTKQTIMREELVKDSSGHKRYFGRSSVRGLLQRISFYTRISMTELLSEKRPQFWVDEPDQPCNKPSTSYTAVDDTEMLNLVEHYFNYVNVTLPLLHKERFLQDIPHRKHERGFSCVLMIVCAIGSQYLNTGTDPQALHFMAGLNYYNNSKAMMLDATTSIATLEDIQAFILLQVYLQKGPSLKSSWAIHGMAVVLAQDIGLCFQWRNDKVDKYTLEQTKRAVWVLFVLDASTAALFGRPRILAAEDIQIGLPSAEGFDEFTYGAETRVTYLNEMIKLYKILGDILSTIYSAKADHYLSVNTVATVNSNLNEWYRRLPDELRDDDKFDIKLEAFPVELREEMKKNGNNDEDDDLKYTRWYLKIAYYMTQIYIYKTFIPDTRSEDLHQFRQTSLEICTNASKSIISTQMKMFCGRANDDRTFFADGLISWGAFTSTLILIINYCECKNNNTENEEDLDFISMAVHLLKVRESRDLMSGRAFDMVSNICAKAGLPIKSTSSPLQTGNLTEYDPQFMNDDLNDALFGVQNLNSFLPLPDSALTDDWSGMLGSMFDANYFI
ncbi:hypothetical protein E3Q22_04347 [Wallemia mellicola]|uniref:Zn(2)-C6 fungal-type domain-containing protein n=1 Tax=Wallemia mellicola TaxID=1708541 RepID=A0A4T0LTL9_9BASI|nr:hypothetical protein E3Q22_04347 [Wallemia mellicola]TIC11446.1 hypothetical protein E3Q13_04402 [Wallemia mellicola]